MQQTNQEIIDEILTMRLLDANLLAINIFKANGELHIELSFERVKTKQLIKFGFSDIVEFDFYYVNEIDFFLVAFLKFFIYDDTIYLSLDPYDEEYIVGEEDNYFIKAKKIYLIA